MAFMIALVVLVLMAGSLSAQSAEQYCSSEKVQGESCYQQCCESLGYSYSGGCNAPESEYDYLDSQCGYCADTYMQCVNNYETYGGQASSGSSSGGGCCAGAILLSLLGVACVRSGA